VHTKNQPPFIDYADVEWKDGVLYSPTFDDVYYQLGEGRAESTHVFLEPNKINARLKQDPQKSFTISELGFGTGLNFLLCYEQWLALEGNKSPLSYIAYEAFPLSPTDIENALSSWPELSSFKTKLVEQYPLPARGSHRLVFEDASVTLTLIFGDVTETLSSQYYKSDAWFLDGFAPNRNESMWNENVIRSIAEKSGPSTTLSTYSAAGTVVRALKKWGFEVNKLSGYGLKREMVSATYNGPANHNIDEETAKCRTQLPNWARSNYSSQPSLKPLAANIFTHKSIVIGSGLAGLTSALALAESGVDCLILEANSLPISEASGQAQLVLYGKYPKHFNREAKLTLAGQLFSQAYFSRLQERSSERFWNPCGVLQLAKGQTGELRHEQLLHNYRFPKSFASILEADQARQVANLNLSSKALWFPASGWLAPKIFANFVLSQDRIRIKTNIHVQAIEKHLDGSWTLKTNQGSYKCEHLVIAAANHTRELINTELFRTKPLRGQITRVASEFLPKPATVICGEGYLCPEIANEIHFGATYDLTSTSCEVSEQDNVANIDNILRWFPTWASREQLNGSVIGGSAGLRCTTSDYTPMVGGLPDQKEMLSQFKELRHDANACKEQFGAYQANAYLNIGHGSKGMISCPIAAEHIASLIADRPSPLDKELELMTSPARFIMRGLARNKL
jgi:tRNA 5-methylaminomethyl-2-thiouridine biosynthesis bifunctional protein